MDTGKLKKFATEARTNLMDGVRLKLRRLGFDERGHAVKTPELISGGTIWNGEEYPEEFHAQWTALRDMLLKRGVREVVETAAYTWFNRMVAIRILAKNNLCDVILTNDEMTGMPRLLAEARMGRVPEMTDQQLCRFEWLMNDDNRTADQFSVLLTAWCHANPIINSCFGSIDDFVEILLPDNILKDNGFLALLNHTDFITDEDFKSAELIGWLYQFYISDRKDEVFAKKGKVEAEEIPAATQIFTPNWIVKYMVQNTIIPQVDASEEVVAECKYLVKTDDFHSRKVELEDLKVADFACGSGHILNECFDLLYELYKAEAYSRREAIECIFTKNLLGIDIDLRAKQLATFALLLKACQRDASFADANCMPRVLTVPGLSAMLKTSKYEDEDGGHGKHINHVFFQNSVTDAVAKEMENALTLLKDADSLGSIIKFNLSASAIRAIRETNEYWKSKDPANRPEFVNNLLPAIDFIMALTDSYDAIVMNPPYMGGGKMDTVLSKYVKGNYNDGSADLATVFVEMAPQHLNKGGEYAFIIPPSWMFLSGFESLRRTIIDNYSIQSLLHLSRGVFGADFGASCAVIKNHENGNFKGTYFRLVERTFQEFDQKHLKELFEKVLENHDFKFLFKDYTKEVSSIEHSDNGAKIYYSGIDQKQFEQIPGAPIAYWVSDKVRETFTSNLPLSAVASPCVGLQTADNGRFLRQWFEVSINAIGFGCTSASASVASGRKFFPTTKGGSFRRWYGNMTYLVNWENNGEELKAFKGSVIRNEKRYFTKSGCSWSTIASGKPSFRYFDKSWLFETKGSVCFPENENDNHTLMGYLNSPLVSHFLGVLSPTLDYHEGPIGRLPYKNIDSTNINDLVSDCISISKQDWDAHETSWDFPSNELVALSNKEEVIRNIQSAVEAFESKWTDLFTQLHANEEELNRHFIEIYGLQDELTPDVPLEEITILQQGEISITDQYALCDGDGSIFADGDDTILRCKGDKYLDWNDDVLIKQLISYIVGVWMGRYRLDKPGLHIAHPNPTEEELDEYSFSITGNQTLKIDVDGIIPVLPADAPFFDNLRNYVVEFVRKLWGDDSLTENINFIEKCLGNSLDDFLMKDFWKYHKKMYQNRPIYWEFASKKGAFRALVYAHRMDRYTVEILRSKYLLPYIGHIERKIAVLELRQNELTTSERRELDNLRNKTLPELREYALRVEVVAGERAKHDPVFDLDDGIIHNHALFGDIVTKLK